MGMPDIAYSAAVTSSRRLQMSSRGELLMTRTYFARVESDRIFMSSSMLMRCAAGVGVDVKWR